MIVTLELTIADDVAPQLIADAALAHGIHDVTTEEAVAALKEKIRENLRSWVISGRTQRERAEAEAAAQAAITAAVSVV